MTRSTTARLAALCLPALALALPVVGQDEKAREKIQRVDVEGISFEAPASWKPVRSTQAMRKAQLRVDPAQGDSEPAELVLYIFPGGAGTTDANVERWRRQFTDRDGETPDVERTAVRGQNAEVTRVEVAGDFTDPFAGGGTRRDYRLLGAIVQGDGAGYFLKMVGPDRTMKEAEPGFDRLIRSIELKK